MILLAVALLFFDSPIAIAMTGIFSTVISCFVNASPNKELIGYSYFEQMRDILPSLLVSLAMFVGVLAVGLLELPSIVILVVQVLTGVVLYVALSAIFRLEPFKMLLAMLKGMTTMKK